MELRRLRCQESHIPSVPIGPAWECDRGGVCWGVRASRHAGDVCVAECVRERETHMRDCEWQGEQ